MSVVSVVQNVNCFLCKDRCSEGLVHKGGEDHAACSNCLLSVVQDAITPQCLRCRHLYDGESVNFIKARAGVWNQHEQSKREGKDKEIRSLRDLLPTIGRGDSEEEDSDFRAAMAASLNPAMQYDARRARETGMQNQQVDFPIGLTAVILSIVLSVIKSFMNQ